MIKGFNKVRRFKMKLLILLTCIIAMFFVSAATFGEIIREGTGTTAAKSASASKGKSEQTEYEEYWWNEYTTEAGTFQWHIEADAEAHASAGRVLGTATYYFLDIILHFLLLENWCDRSNPA
jgi:hypothetical protein